MTARPDSLAVLRSDAILARAHRIEQARLSSHPQDATLKAMDEWRRSEAARADIAALVAERDRFLKLILETRDVLARSGLGTEEECDGADLVDIMADLFPAFDKIATDHRQKAEGEPA